MITHNVRSLVRRLPHYINPAELQQRAQFSRLRTAFYGDLWRTAAHELGGELTEWEAGLFAISRDGMTTVVRLSSVMMDDHLTLQIMGNKRLTSNILREKGIPVPESR